MTNGSLNHYFDPPPIGRLPSSSHSNIVCSHRKTVKTDHLTGTSAHALQRPMVTYTGIGAVDPGPHGLLRHGVSIFSFVIV
ncbi:hypothetical protein TNCV_4983151 [Trichonephila clavipes]|uniref:Uncharacterized protein n=1 Tax=Trichonephila clavipes TaxID=2585209 RepID=A0A8X7BKW0_TRICX|nr:hypothetical protein TNCV_4983151 [Trichonephila clavipes]